MGHEVPDPKCPVPQLAACCPQAGEEYPHGAAFDWMANVAGYDPWAHWTADWGAEDQYSAPETLKAVPTAAARANSTPPPKLTEVLQSLPKGTQAEGGGAEAKSTEAKSTWNAVHVTDSISSLAPV